MQFPICEKCLEGELICDSCASVVGEAGIKEKEIKMMRKLNKRMGKYDVLKDAKISRAVDNGEMVVIVADKGSASLIIGKDGGMAKQIGKDIGRHVRVVPESKNVDEFMRNLFHNTHILGVNVVFGEKKVYRVNIPVSERNSLPVDPEEFSRISSAILNEQVELIFV
jgi:transcription antitermination factor NusA-like protein